MKVNELFEAKVTYEKVPNKRFRVFEDTFNDVKNSDTIRKHSGPNTTVIDVTEVEDISLAPGENKWNAMRRLYGHDEDEIVCAKSFDKEWICMSINVLI